MLGQNLWHQRATWKFLMIFSVFFFFLLHDVGIEEWLPRVDAMNIQ